MVNGRVILDAWERVMYFKWRILACFVLKSSAYFVNLKREDPAYDRFQKNTVAIKEHDDDITPKEFTSTLHLQHRLEMAYYCNCCPSRTLPSKLSDEKIIMFCLIQVEQGSIASQDGRIREGDQILQVS